MPKVTRASAGKNLANFGILPLEFENAEDYERIRQGDEIRVEHLRNAVANGETIVAHNRTRDESYSLTHSLSERQINIMLAGGAINYLKSRRNSDN